MNLKPVLFSMCGILSFGTLQAETPSYQVGDKVEFLLTDPAHNMIKFRKDSSELDRSYALEWDVIDVDQAGKKCCSWQDREFIQVPTALMNILKRSPKEANVHSADLPCLTDVKAAL